MKSQIFFLLISLLLSASTGLAQITFSEPNRPSPQAASLGKFVDIPVSLHTGVPQITIPLYTVSDGGLQLPISIGYHSSGIRVDEVASWVGLGWSLNAGGMISRSVNGGPDEGNTRMYSYCQSGACQELPYSYSGYYEKNGDMSLYNNCLNNPNSHCLNTSSYSCHEIFRKAARGYLDTEPDMYTYNFGAYSGKFTFGVNASGNVEVYTIPQQDIKFVPTHDPVNKKFTSWYAITPDGTKYYFGNLFGKDATEYGYSTTNSSELMMNTTTWYLVRIESADGTDQINLTYAPEQYSYGNRGSHTVKSTYAPAGCGPQGSYTTMDPSITITSISGRRLTQITTKKGFSTVNFVAINNRPDLTQFQDYFSCNNQAKYLDRIEIVYGGKTKKIQFNITTFNSALNSSYNTYSTTCGADAKRLKLETIQEFDNNANSIPPYIFTYNSLVLPRRYSLARDAYGYYNGYDLNPGLMPNFQNPCSGATLITGNIRTADATKMKACMLEQIKYPTGGTTSLVYENHKTSSTSTEVIGGLRIKTITQLDNPTGIPVVKNYEYGPGNLVGNNSGYYGYAPGDNLNNHGNLGNYGAFLVAGTPVTMQTTLGTHITYSIADEKYADNSYKRFKYKNTNPIPQMLFPFFPTQFEIGGGTLVGEEQYNSSGVLVGKTDYIYEEAGVKIIPAIKVAVANFDCSIPVCYMWGCSVCCDDEASMYNTYNIRTARFRLKQKVDLLDGVTTTTDFQYHALNSHGNPILTSFTNSNGNIFKTYTYYAHDVTTTEQPVRQQLLDRNMVGIPLKMEQSFGVDTKKTGTRVIYGNPTGSTTFPVPVQYQVLDKLGNYETKTTIQSYSAGVPTQVLNAGFSTPSVYNWNTLEKKLNSKVFGTLTWTYSYDPLSDQLFSKSDENGIGEHYFYDSFFRLTQMKGQNGASGHGVITDHTYHFNQSDPKNNYIKNRITFKESGGDVILESRSFFDGLGRATQSQKLSYISGTNGTQVTGLTYDNQGRQKRTYQPFDAGAASSFTTIPGTTAYKESEYELSPLNRVVKAYNEDGTFVQIQYGSNSNAIPKFTNAGVQSGFHVIGSLFQTTTIDEDGKQSREFKDKAGRTVSSAKMLNGTWEYTHYVYDDYNQLVFVIPPGISSGSNAAAFEYQYDNKFRMFKKRVATMGTGKEQLFYYNERDLVVLTQDANMRNSTYGGAANKFLATQYDNLGRVVKTGWWFGTPNLVNGNVADVTITDNNNLLSETTYETNKNRPIQTKLRVLNPDAISPSFLTTSYTYDTYGRVYTKNTGNHLGKSDLSTFTYNFADKITAFNRQLTSTGVYSGFRDWAVTGSTTYDQGLREVNNFFSFSLSDPYLSPVNTGIHQLSNKSYDVLDRLKEKNLGKAPGKTNFLQSIDYYYNSRGFLTGINTPQTTNNGQEIFDCTMANMPVPATPTAPVEAGDIYPDVFAQKLYYGSLPVGNPMATTARNNGNIAQIDWQVFGRKVQAYGFTYDDFNRMTDAHYADQTTTSQYNKNQRYRESITYADARGNIQNLTRRGQVNTCTINDVGDNYYLAGDYNVIDNLTYTYNTTNNRLATITEASSVTKGFKATSSTYTYDDNGNLINDSGKRLTIEYNHLNLPTRFTFRNTSNVITGVITIWYDASGKKLRKIVDDRTSTNDDYSKDYLDGIELTNGIVDQVAHTEGRIKQTNINLNLYQVEYQVQDHLGNTRVMFSDLNNNGTLFGVTTAQAEIIQVNHYYPFGMNMEGPWNGSATDRNLNKYQYNGKELNQDFGLEWNDHGARWYDATIGRWHAVDPLAEKHEGWTPYNFVLSNPLIYNDPLGLDTNIVYVFDQSNRPQDNGTAGNTYTADIFVYDTESGELAGPYEGSSYPNSKSNTDNTTRSNTINEGTHDFNNASGHKGGTKQGLNVVDASGNRRAEGTDPQGNDITMTMVNVHEGASDNGNYNSRGSDGCITINPSDSESFFLNFDWSGRNGTTGDSTGKIVIKRENKAEESKQLQEKAVKRQNEYREILKFSWHE